MIRKPTVRCKVDADACMGSGRCLAEAPDIFEFGESGQARVRNERVDSLVEADLPLLEAARDSCPTAAIRLDHEREC